MASIYERMAVVSQKLLRPASDGDGGFGQGAIALVKYTAGTAPVNPWGPPSTPTRTETPLQGAARGVSADLVGSEIAPGVQLVASDLVVIVSPWGSPAALVGDVMEIDNKDYTIMRVDRIPAAGTVSAWRFYVRA